MLKAIDRFDLDRGVEFTTYATPTIVGEIKRYFRDKGWAVKVPRRLQELNLAVNRAIEKLTVKLGHSPTVAELAAHLGASEEDVLEAQELGRAYNLLSLDTELNGDGDKEIADARRLRRPERHRARPAGGPRQPRARRSRCSRGRERVILYLRFYESVSQTEIAAAPQRLADARFAPADKKRSRSSATFSKKTSASRRRRFADHEVTGTPFELRRVFRSQGARASRLGVADSAMR